MKLIRTVSVACGLLTMMSGGIAPAGQAATGGAAAASTASAACDAVAKAGITISSGISATEVCNTVVGDWTQRPIEANPPRRYSLSVENDQFAKQLADSLHAVKANRYNVVIVDFASSYVKTEAQIRQAIAPDYAESALGVWLDRIGDHNGVKQLKTGESLVILPLLFEWIGKPVVKFLIDHFFKRDPYSDAKKVDAYVVTYSGLPNAGAIARICFVKRGAQVNDSICPRN